MLLLVLAILAAYTSLFAEKPEHDQQYELYVNEIVSAFEKQIGQELKLDLIRWYGDFHDYLEKGMEFKAYRRATLDEARAMILSLMTKLSDAIQAHEKIQPYLKHQLLTPETMKVNIRFVTTDGRNFSLGPQSIIYLLKEISFTLQQLLVERILKKLLTKPSSSMPLFP